MNLHSGATTSQPCSASRRLRRFAPLPPTRYTLPDWLVYHTAEIAETAESKNTKSSPRSLCALRLIESYDNRQCTPRRPLGYGRYAARLGRVPLAGLAG